MIMKMTLKFALGFLARVRDFACDCTCLRLWTAFIVLQQHSVYSYVMFLSFQYCARAYFTGTV